MKTAHMIITLALFAVLSIPEASLAAQGQRLDTAQAQARIGAVIPDMTVLAIDNTPVEGLYEVVVQDQKGGKGILYITEDMRHLIAGSIIDMQRGKNLTQLRFDSLSSVDFSSIPLEDALVMGNPEAKHKVIVLTDPD